MYSGTSFCTALVLAVVASPSGASAQAYVFRPGGSADTTAITVNAVGEVRVSPDVATVYGQIQSTSENGEALVAENKEVRSALFEALGAAGIPDTALAQWGYGIGRAANMNRRMGPEPLDTTFDLEAKVGVRITVSPIEQLDGVVQILLEHGVENVTVLFDAVPDAATRERALEMAVSQARRDAEVIAAAAGGEIGTLVRINSNPDFTGMVERSRFLAIGFSDSMMGRGVQLTPSDVTVRVQIQATWVFLPG